MWNVYRIFFSFTLGTVQCLYVVVGHRRFSNNAIMFCLGLVFLNVWSFLIQVVTPSWLQSDIHSILCIGYLVCQPRCPLVVFFSDDLSSPCPFILVYIFYPHTSFFMDMAVSSFHVMLSITLSWARCIVLSLRVFSL